MKRNSLPFVVSILAVAVVGAFAAWMTDIPRLIQGACNAPNGTHFDLVFTTGPSATVGPSATPLPAKVPVGTTVAFSAAVGSSPAGYYANSSPAWTPYGTSKTFTQTGVYFNVVSDSHTDTFGNTCSTSGVIRIEVVDIDLDIDSDTTTDYGGPARDAFEDSIEEGPGGITNEGLKFVVVNELHETSEKGKPGYIDWQIGSPFGPATNDANIFVPLVLEIPPPFNNPIIRFIYPGLAPEEPPTTTTVDGETTYPLTTTSQDRARLWRKPMGGARGPAAVTASNGDYIPDNTDLTKSQVGFSGTTATIYLEALANSDSMEDIVIEAQVTETLWGTSYTLKDKIKATFVRIDLDVDSNNNDGTNVPQRNLAEDHYEDILVTSSDQPRPGKIVIVNDNDDDADNITDYADGYNRNGTSGDSDDTPSSNERFIPLVLEVPAPVDLYDARIRITYDASDPINDISSSGAILSGHMRIWTKNGNVARNANPIDAATPGDYVKPGTYPAEKFGLSGSQRTVTLFIEAVACSDSAGDQRIMVELDPNGDVKNPANFIAADAVRTTLISLPRILAVTDHFTPRQQESPPYHVCKVDYLLPCDGYLSSPFELILEVKEQSNTWSSLFYAHSFNTGTATNTRLYNLNKRYDITGKFTSVYPAGINTERVCWDGRKDADGNNVIDQDSNNVPIWADCPENIAATPERFDVRMRIRYVRPDGTETNWYTSSLDTQTCPLPRDSNNEACAGPAPYFGYFRDSVNSKYDNLFLSANSIAPKTDGRPAPAITTYFNGNHWWHTPMAFGWTHNYEMRMMPTRINGVETLFLLGPGNHLFGPADTSSNIWIYGERATVTELSGGGWSMTNREYTVYTFDANGQLTKIEDRNSNTVTVALDPYAAGLLIKRVASVTGAGLTLQLTYDPTLENTRLTQATISDRTVAFDYYEAADQFGTNYGPDEILKTANGPEYNRTFSVTECRRRDPPSRVITGMVTTQQVGDVFFNYEYGTVEDLTTLKSEAIVNSYKVGTNGGFWRQTMIAGQTATYNVGRTVTHSYSGNKLQSATVSQGGDSATYNYDYNTYGQRTKQTTANGDTILDPYDSVGNLEKITPPDEAVINFEYGACNQVKRRWQTSGSATRETTYALDGCGNVTNITQTGDATVSNRTWLLTRKTDGSIDTVTYPTPSTVGQATYTYDNSLGLVAKITRGGIALLDDTHDTFGNVTVAKDCKTQETKYDFDKWDRVKKTTYPNTKTEQFEYRPLNDLTKHILPPGGTNTPGATNEYQYAGPSGKPTGHTVKGSGIDQTNTYTNVNDEGSVLAMTASEGGDNLQSAYEYDYADRTTSETWAGAANPRWKAKYDPLGNALESTDGESKTTLRTYYSDNSVNVLTRPGSFGTVTHNRDNFGNITEIVDVIGGAGITATTTIDVDPFDRAWRITDPLTNVWKRAFDALDNVTNLTPPRGYAYTYEYDSRGYPSNCIYADGAQTYIGTDDNGDLSSVTVPKGGVYSYGVDSMRNRLGFQPPSSSGSPVGKYGSDQNSTFGQSFQFQAGGRQHTVGRDDGGRVASHKPPHAPTGTSRVIQQALFGAKTVNLMDGVTATRDPVTTDPTKRKWQQGPRTTETTFNGNDQVKEVKMNATISGDTTKTATIEYNDLGLPEKIIEGGKTNKTTYDGHGNILTKEISSTLTAVAKYDAADRLKKLTVDGKVVNYDYDGNGNCTMLDPGGPLKMTMAYDKRDMLTNRTILISGSLYRTETIARDSNGAIVGRTIRNASGVAVCNESFGRDAADRMTNFTAHTATDAAFLSWAEDSQMTAEAWGGTWSLALSAGGLVTSSTASPTFTFTRDAEGKVTDVSLSGSTIYHYDYDTAGQLKKITDNTDSLGGTAVIDRSLDGTGHAMVRDLPGGAQLTEKLNEAGLVTESIMTVNGVSKTVTINRTGGTAISQIARDGSAPDTIFGYDTDHHLHCPWFLAHHRTGT